VPENLKGTEVTGTAFALSKSPNSLARRCPLYVLESLDRGVDTNNGAVQRNTGIDVVLHAGYRMGYACGSATLCGTCSGCQLYSSTLSNYVVMMACFVFQVVS
jgi:hypothetical protein